MVEILGLEKLRRFNIFSRYCCCVWGWYLIWSLHCTRICYEMEELKHYWSGRSEIRHSLELMIIFEVLLILSPFPVQHLNSSTRRFSFKHTTTWIVLLQNCGRIVMHGRIEWNHEIWGISALIPPRSIVSYLLIFFYCFRFRYSSFL